MSFNLSEVYFKFAIMLGAAGIVGSEAVKAHTWWNVVSLDEQTISRQWQISGELVFENTK